MNPTRMSETIRQHKKTVEGERSEVAVHMAAKTNEFAKIDIIISGRFSAQLIMVISKNDCCSPISSTGNVFSLNVLVVILYVSFPLQNRVLVKFNKMHDEEGFHPFPADNAPNHFFLLAS